MTFTFIVDKVFTLVMPMSKYQGPVSLKGLSLGRMHLVPTETMAQNASQRCRSHLVPYFKHASKRGI